MAAEPYLRTADPTPGGVNWAVRPSSARSHHVAHGTLGIAYALAAVGMAAGRRDLVELALRGAADVVARDEAGPEDSRRPAFWPTAQARPDRAVQLRLVQRPGGRRPGVPAARLGHRGPSPGRSGRQMLAYRYPLRTAAPDPTGFWDNSGHCCGTAGVLALACDRHAEQAEDLGFAGVLVADLAARATVEADGARWSNHEHRTGL